MKNYEKPNVLIITLKNESIIMDSWDNLGGWTTEWDDFFGNGEAQQ